MDCEYFTLDRHGHDDAVPRRRGRPVPGGGVRRGGAGEIEWNGQRYPLAARATWCCCRPRWAMRRCVPERAESRLLECGLPG